MLYRVHFFHCTVIQQNWVKIISALTKVHKLPWEKNNINEITEEHIFLGIYEENSKESSVLNKIINMYKFSFWKSHQQNVYKHQKLYF